MMHRTICKATHAASLFLDITAKHMNAQDSWGVVVWCWHLQAGSLLWAVLGWPCASEEARRLGGCSCTKKAYSNSHFDTTELSESESSAES